MMGIAQAIAHTAAAALHASHGTQTAPVPAAARIAWCPSSLHSIFTELSTQHRRGCEHCETHRRDAGVAEGVIQGTLSQVSHGLALESREDAVRA
jgi:hypothetical protein